MNRRNFLITGAIGTSVLGLAAAKPWTALLSANPQPENLMPEGWFVLGSTEHRPQEAMDGGRRTSLVSAGVIDRIHFRKQESIQLRVPIFPHGFAFAPEPSLLFTAQKWGNIGIVADLKCTRILKEIKAPEGVSYSGHGLFVDKGRTLLISGEANTGEGKIFFYDVNRDYALTRTLTGSRRIHDLQVLDENRILVAIVAPLHGPDSYGAQGALQIVSLRSGEFSEFFAVPEGSHILKLGQDQYVVGGVNGTRTPLALGFVDWKNKVTRVITDSADFNKFDLHGEALSLARIGPRLVAFTAPDSGLVGVWNFDDNRLTALSMGERPLGLIANGDLRFVANSKSGQFRSFRFDPREMRIEELQSTEAIHANGRHIYQAA